MSSTPSIVSASRTSTPSSRPFARTSIDCNFERTGMIDVATAPWQYTELLEVADEMRAHGYRVDTLDQAAHARRGGIRPPITAGCRIHDRTAIVNPAKLAWGLRRACLDAGVRLHDNSAVIADSTRESERIKLTTASGGVSARRVALATNADRPLLQRLRPVHPSRVRLRARHRTALGRRSSASIGWAHRQGIGDSGNQFHYYRLTADSRILWGGYDAIYHFGNRVDVELEQRGADVRQACRATSSPPFRNSRASASRTDGAARSTPAAASAPSGEPATAGASPTRSDTRGSASGRRVSARR